MAGDIEFLDAEPPHDGGDDHLPPHGPKHAQVSRRTRIVGVVAGGAVLAGLLIARIATSSDHVPAAQSSSAAQPVVVQHSASDGSAPKLVYCDTIVTIPDHPISVQVIPLSPGKSGWQSAGQRIKVILGSGGVTYSPQSIPPFPSVSPHSNCTTTAPKPCPRTKDSSDCTSTASLPGEFLNTVHRSFPGAKVVSAQTYVVSADHRLWERSVTLSQGYNRITIVVGQHGTELGPSLAHDDGSHLQLRAVAETATSDVLVVVTEPSGSSHTTLQTVIDFAGQRGLSTL